MSGLPGALNDDWLRFCDAGADCDIGIDVDLSYETLARQAIVSAAVDNRTLSAPPPSLRSK